MEALREARRTARQHRSRSRIARVDAAPGTPVRFVPVEHDGRSAPALVPWITDARATPVCLRKTLRDPASSAVDALNLIAPAIAPRGLLAGGVVGLSSTAEFDGNGQGGLMGMAFPETAHVAVAEHAWRPLTGTGRERVPVLATLIHELLHFAHGPVMIGPERVYDIRHACVDLLAKRLLAELRAGCTRSCASSSEWSDPELPVVGTAAVLAWAAEQHGVTLWDMCARLLAPAGWRPIQTALDARISAGSALRTLALESESEREHRLDNAELAQGLGILARHARALASAGDREHDRSAAENVPGLQAIAHALRPYGTWFGIPDQRGYLLDRVVTLIESRVQHEPDQYDRDFIRMADGSAEVAGPDIEAFDGQGHRVLQHRGGPRIRLEPGDVALVDEIAAALRRAGDVPGATPLYEAVQAASRRP